MGSGVLGNEEAEPLPPAELDMSGLPDGVPKVATWAAKWEAAERTGLSYEALIGRIIELATGRYSR